VAIDNEVAQIYYDKALLQKSTQKVPIYLMSFYNRWQSLDLVHTLTKFAHHTINTPWSTGGGIVII
jgi:hypothetical protein